LPFFLLLFLLLSTGFLLLLFTLLGYLLSLGVGFAPLPPTATLFTITALGRLLIASTPLPTRTAAIASAPNPNRPRRPALFF